MEIDEPPSDKRNRRPDIDTNGIMDAHDILIFCFGTLRYDVSVAEEASGGTPVLDSYGSGRRKRHTPGNFIYPSHFAIFAGFLPSPVESHMLHNRKWLFFPLQTGTGRIPPEGSYAFKKATFVQSLSNIGYETICIGGTSFFGERNDIGRIFPSYFNKSYWLSAFGCIDKNGAANQTDFAVNKLEEYPADRKILVYINFSTVHYSNCHYVKGKKEDDRESHAAALRYINSRSPYLFKAFRRRSDTLVIALSDHGIYYGEDGYEYHYIFHEKVYVVPHKHFTLRK